MTRLSEWIARLLAPQLEDRAYAEGFERGFETATRYAQHIEDARAQLLGQKNA